MSSSQQLPILPTWSAITSATSSAPRTPLGIDIQILKYHLSWSVPTILIVIIAAIVAYRMYKHYKRTGRIY